MLPEEKKKLNKKKTLKLQHKVASNCESFTLTFTGNNTQLSNYSRYESYSSI